MRSMSRVERFFERLVERPTARVFGTRLQPIQVLRRVERAMEAGRERFGGRDVAPDRFVVRLHPRDIARIGGLDALADYLAVGALAFARARSWNLGARPRVAIHADVAVERGDASVEATIAAPRAPDLPDAGELGGPAGTRVFEVPIVRAPRAVLEVREPGRPSRQAALDGRPLIIGRGADCDLVLGDSHASRQHARLDARDGVLVLTDLGSTNGTRVNGHRINEVVLGEGDSIEIGETVLVVGTGAGPSAG